MSFESPTKTQIGYQAWVFAEEIFNTGVSGQTTIFYAAPCDLGTYHIENQSSQEVHVVVKGVKNQQDTNWIPITSLAVAPGSSEDIPSDKFASSWNPYISVEWSCDAPLDGDLKIAVAAKGGDEGAGNMAFRLFNNQPAPGYRVWRDTDDLNHIYVIEAPAGTLSNETGFRGIRISKSATGLSGVQEENSGGTLTFDNRTTDGGWS